MRLKRFERKIAYLFFSAVMALALLFGVVFALPQTTAKAATAMSADNWSIALESNLIFRVQNGTTYWNTYTNNVTTASMLDYTEINGKTLTEINAETPGAVTVTLQPGGAIGSFYRVCISESAGFDIYDIGTFKLNAGWSHTDANDTYTLSSDLYFTRAQNSNTWSFVPTANVVDITDDIVISDQGVIVGGTRAILINSKQNCWTAGTPNEAGGAFTHMYYVNGKSVAEWNDEAHAALSAGTITDITYGSQHGTISGNKGVYAPIFVWNAAYDAGVGGSYAQAWIPTNYISDVSSFKIAKGMGWLTDGTLYYVSEDVEYVKVYGTFTKVTGGVVDITDDFKVGAVQARDDGTTLYYLSTGTQRWTNNYGQAGTFLINEGEWKGQNNGSLQGGSVQMSYIEFNGTSLYDLNVSDNGTYDATMFPITNGGKYAPIVANLTPVEVGSSIKLNIPNAYGGDGTTAAENHKTLTIKAGFYVLDSSTGIKYEVTEDVEFVNDGNGNWDYKYEAIETTVTDAKLFGSSTDAFAGIALNGSDYASAPSTYAGATKTALSYAQSANFYPYVLIDGNPLSAPGEAFLNVWSNFGYFTFRPGNNSATSITIKAGCQFPTYAALETGAREYYVNTADVTFVKVNDTWMNEKDVSVTLSFEGTSTVITPTKGAAIGTLPEIPEKTGYTAGVWTIDGVEITAETVWNYTESKTAKATYTANTYELSFNPTVESGIITVTYDQAIGELPAVPTQEGYTNGVWTIDGVEITAETVWNYTENKTAVIGESTAISYTLQFGGDRDLIEDHISLSFPSKNLYMDNEIVEEDGNKMLYLHRIANGGAQMLLVDTGITMAAGVEYTISFKMKTAQAVHLWNNDGALIKDWVWGAGADVWAEYAYTTTLNAASSIFKIQTPGDGAVAASDIVIYIDDLRIYQTKTVTYGEAIGELPSVPTNKYYETSSSWKIGHTALTADTIWTYPNNQIATAEYTSVKAGNSFSLQFGEKSDDLTEGTIYLYNVNNNATGVLETVTDGAYSGTAVKLYKTSGQLNVAIETVGFTYEAGKTYNVSYRMKSAGSIHVCKNDYSTGLSDYLLTDWVPGIGDSGWKTISYTFTATNTTKYVNIMLATDGEMTLYVDDIRAVEVKTVTTGSAIGELPEVAPVDGYAGYWFIDGKKLSADTVWNMVGDKVATSDYVSNDTFDVVFGDTTTTIQFEVGEPIVLDETFFEDCLGRTGEVNNTLYLIFIDGEEFSPGEVWTPVNGASIEFQTIAFGTEEGASVRVTGESGIRFETRISVDQYNSLVQDYGEENIEFGTYIFPADLLGASSVRDYLEYYGEEGVDYINVVCNGFYRPEETEADGYYHYYGSITNVKTKNYARDFIGVGYIIIDGNYYYGAGVTDTHTRSVFYVANAAWNNKAEEGFDETQQGKIQEYLNTLPNVTITDGVSSNVYTDFTPEYEIGTTDYKNYVAKATGGNTINGIVVNGNMARVANPATSIYFFWDGTYLEVLSSDDATTYGTAMQDTIVYANSNANIVQGFYDNINRTGYTIANSNVAIHTALNSAPFTTTISNGKGQLAKANVTLNGGAVVLKDDTNHTHNFQPAHSNGYARANNDVLGYYYNETAIRDMGFNGTSGIFFEKTYHVYPDKAYQNFRLINSTQSAITCTNLVITMTISGVTKTSGNAGDGYYALMTANGVVGFIVPEGNGTLAVSNSGTTYTVTQTIASISIAGSTQLIYEGASLYTGSDAEFGHRLYTDNTASFDGFNKAVEEEKDPLDGLEISVENVDGAEFIAYDPLTGLYNFNLDGYHFGEAQNDPDKVFMADITIKSKDDRIVYLRTNTTTPLEGAALLDSDNTLLPVPMQVTKNFGNENEEPLYRYEGGANDDWIWGDTFVPVSLKMGTTYNFTILNADQDWGNYPVKQISSIAFYDAYYHMSTGTLESNCVVPYFNTSDGGYGAFLPDFRGMTTKLQDDDGQHINIGNIYTPMNNTGASSEMSKIFGVYQNSEIISSGLTHLDMVTNYVASDGSYKFSMRHVEQAHTDESRTYYTIKVEFLKTTTIKNTTFSLLAFDGCNPFNNGFFYQNTSYLGTDGNLKTIDNGVTINYNKNKYLFGEASGVSSSINPLKTDGSYYVGHNIPTTVKRMNLWNTSATNTTVATNFDTTASKRTGNIGIIIKDEMIVQNGVETTQGLAVYNSWRSANNSNYIALTLANSSTTFVAGDSITVDLILLPYGGLDTVNDGVFDTQNIDNVQAVYEESVTNSLTVSATTGSVVEDTWLPIVKSEKNVAQFTLTGGGTGVNYVMQATGFTHLVIPTVEEYVDGAWVTYDAGSDTTRLWDGYSVWYDVETGTYTYAFNFTQTASGRTFRVSA